MTLDLTKSVLEKVYAADRPAAGDIVYLLSLQDHEDIRLLYDFADKVRKDFVGDGVLLRGIVEFSNYCRGSCCYCGLNKNNNSLQRYRLTNSQIKDAVAILASAGIKTVVLQSGEDDQLDVYQLKELIEEIKSEFDMAITLSVGERTKEEYQLWKSAGADRYLLKIETTNRGLYDKLHPSMSFENRLKCLDDLRELGYQVGCGNIIGLKGQTIDMIAGDIVFFGKYDFDMIGIGPFIPHGMTILANESKGTAELTIKATAVTRIVTKNSHLPATTSLGSLSKDDARMAALQAGANVIMPNFTPQEYKKLYEIYPGKRCIDESGAKCADCLDGTIRSIGRYIDFSRGDTLKNKIISGC